MGVTQFLLQSQVWRKSSELVLMHVKPLLIATFHHLLDHQSQTSSSLYNSVEPVQMKLMTTYHKSSIDCLQNQERSDLRMKELTENENMDCSIPEGLTEHETFDF